MQSRAVRPYPPTAVTFNGQSFPAALSNGAPINVAWKRRNRENAAILFPSNADEAPEVGTEYCVVHEGIEENLGNGTAGTFRFLADGTHTVEVFARREGWASNRLTFQTTVTGSAAPPGTPPGDPAGLTAAGGSLSNVLNWTAAGNSPLGYSVYALQGPGTFANATIVGSTSGLTFTHRGLAPGAAWRYWVVAYNGSGTSGPSNEATATAFSGGNTGSSYTGSGDPETPGEEGDSYTDTSRVPPVPWIYVDGAWVRQTTYDIALTWIGIPPSLKTFLTFQAVRDFTLPANLTGSQFLAKTPTTNMGVVIEIKKNGVQIGTITFSIGNGVPVVSFPSTVSFVQGDDLQLVSPLNLDGMRDLFITLSAYR
ncbi:hypothetical protein BABAJAGA_00120 [Brevundimonas phage vB_BgoS-BabaJaga]|nr:hypothetical protein BABAJAGA_00120 [Brevundimonas phage vB_BgoS-BabaJaga]